MSSKALYRSWHDMKRRCDIPSMPAYRHYGERGITYTPAWKTFEGFAAEMESTWFIGATIDRVDNNLGYCKDNCRWILKKDQTSVGKQSLRYNNKTGIVGIEYFRGGYRVLVRERGKPRNQGKKYLLYRGLDFFEACCARKSWENAEKKLTASQKLGNLLT